MKKKKRKGDKEGPKPLFDSGSTSTGGFSPQPP